MNKTSIKLGAIFIMFLVISSIVNGEIVSMPQYGFKIDSLGGEINRNGVLGSALTMYVQRVAARTPSVSVEIHPMIKTSMSQFYEKNIKECTANGMTILSSTLVSPNECQIVYKGNYKTDVLCQIYRAVTHGNNLYLIISCCDAGAQWQEYGQLLKGSINSFSFN